MATDEQKGFGRPPVTSRFAKGKSGNPRGRPRGSRNAKAPYESVLGQLVTVRSESGERRITAAEAFILQMTKRGLNGDASAAKATLDAIEALPSREHLEAVPDIAAIILQFQSSPGQSGSFEQFVETMRIAKMLDPYRETARLVLEPWIVELALERLGTRQLNLGEQQVVWKGTRTPRKVRWPVWWSYNGD